MFKERVEKALADLQAGKLVLVMDDEDRENEGDLICAAKFATTDNVNLMASQAKGLICMPMSEDIAQKLDFQPMVAHNTDNHQTAFTVSIDHVATTTGISAEERGLTARKVVAEDARPEDFRRPGHMFPLVAKAGGVLERNGHTEATVDLMRLAGLEACGLCCEIMADNGQMMRGPELKAFAADHELSFLTIKDLQAYRKRYDQLLDREADVALPTRYGDFRLVCFVDRLTGQEHLALTMGDLDQAEDVICRLHSECLTGDVFGSERCDCGAQLDQALAQISQTGRGVLLYMRQEGRGIGLVNKLKAYHLQEEGLDTLEANLALGQPADAREYYLGAQMLRALGVQSVRLLTNNPDKVQELEANGMPVSERLPLEIPANAHDANYLLTKKIKMGHLLDLKEDN
ncbi:bifunctional 3,4-dihydroxy-2-butanone-4-phosphate synthase/GTP cyclohydrolase II [Aerococcus sp. UMB7834]|uniref:bifunctional 3,4-dihydroxy-2-butanone-4-phosphate synthase/GTP cyclohydrolase II n=1 Tax=Aerococcus sp. UMB7834 TaxID=3046342 RepID=UPI0025505247|nr:bifunctional 3,4-dihydroxy-2-butanone-4-phosphate synthase/GTP cyclohydrolase II [Aerococcus sp. UMB7834]MDK6805126.1 bifunctional 3,4-dihydroxy-2-butanone-4-phosphate synthase/GTP cyclohydrolase II [Aerococcus sp. UMB7834]